MAVQCAMQYWSWEKLNFKVDDDADIPALNGADAAADQNKHNEKHKFIDGPMITDGVNSRFWWIYSSMILFAEDVMVAVRAMSCPCHKLAATTKYMRSLCFVNVSCTYAFHCDGLD